jgi:predicted extracellular nuclease
MIAYIKILFLLLFIAEQLYSQSLSDTLTKRVEADRYARVMFYNCENLFDTYNDSAKRDEDFTPEGNHHWNKSKYYNKLNKIAKVIVAVGGWQPVELVGLCEIENIRTLKNLIYNSQLYLLEYKFIHKESPDRRGIDVALLYQPKKYKPLKNTFIPICFPDKSDKLTRDILYSKGILHQKDTIHIFVNHWPSRWGGQLQSESYRIYVASVLKHITDSVFKASPLANIIIIGDFNDEPTNKSLSKILNAKLSVEQPVVQNNLYNLASISYSYSNIGSHKHHGKWAKLDQIIVSGSLLTNSNKLKISIGGYTIFNAGFLFEKDESYLGYKPYRTYIGFKYHGGYSDHLPVFIDINKIKQNDF